MDRLYLGVRKCGASASVKKMVWRKLRLRSFSCSFFSSSSFSFLSQKSSSLQSDKEVGVISLWELFFFFFPFFFFVFLFFLFCEQGLCTSDLFKKSGWQDLHTSDPTSSEEEKESKRKKEDCC